MLNNFLYLFPLSAVSTRIGKYFSFFFKPFLCLLSSLLAVVRYAHFFIIIFVSVLGSSCAFFTSTIIYIPFWYENFVPTTNKGDKDREPMLKKRIVAAAAARAATDTQNN